MSWERLHEANEHEKTKGVQSDCRLSDRERNMLNLFLMAPASTDSWLLNDFYLKLTPVKTNSSQLHSARKAEMSEVQHTTVPLIDSSLFCSPAAWFHYYWSIQHKTEMELGKARQITAFKKKQLSFVIIWDIFVSKRWSIYGTCECTLKGRQWRLHYSLYVSHSIHSLLTTA